MSLEKPPYTGMAIAMAVVIAGLLLLFGAPWWAGVLAGLIVLSAK